MHILAFTTLLALAGAQRVAKEQKEVHPKLAWKQCSAGGICAATSGEVVVDSNWRWIHPVNGFANCYQDNDWNHQLCDTEAHCTDTCALEGADYRFTGVTAVNDSLTMKFKTYQDFAYNVGSRLFLMESTKKYQMFTLMNNELAFDVDLSTVECGINSALYFVAMEQDGGVASYPTNKAGAEYGTGYCDAHCARDLKYIAGKTNSEAWKPSATDAVGGVGNRGACCAEIDVWNSNAHSFSLSAHSCQTNGYQVCEGPHCDKSYINPDDESEPLCDTWGCDYNPYRMGVTDFYGKGKTVNTTKKFTVVTRFDETKISQFFIQDGQKIDIPPPAWDGLPKASGISPELCENMFKVFGERDRFTEIGGWSKTLETLKQPMVLTLSILSDHTHHNLWLDSVFPPQDEGLPGSARGECIAENNDPAYVEGRFASAKVVWSNLRFGPIGSTVAV